MAVDRSLLRPALELARGDVARAERVLADVRRDAPNAYLGAYGRAYALQTHGQHERCIAALRIVRILQPAFPGSDLLSGRALASLGRRDEAIRAFDAYLAQDSVTTLDDEARREFDKLGAGKR